MTWPDITNGTYELLGGFFILAHCWRLWKDKRVRGVSFIAVVFFASWGMWNLYYYPHLGQWWSFSGGVFIVAANSFWIGMMVYYKRIEAGATAKEKQESG